ncbi:hypothetical protein FDW83_09295 [Pseudarthrobacter sp. NamE2]|uniref:hypothetical protein n=1 Tax=Pseudarthrobacter sp. NamE2 TaxID=2576838 RepID=UPI0010FE2751|nr:hypothetical protein [Pseudarthrobacter sp. NamE2]TLM83644.1 hypothetical protein FDW83_09295 [Pseudarthrobacter sp. NamE2]
MKIIPVTDPSEIAHSQRIMGYFQRTEEVATALGPLISPQSGSGLAQDDARCPHHDVAGYAFNQLTVATSCIEAMRRMMVQESDQSIMLTASAFGAYALARNSMDAAATALWLLEPVNGTLRIKRRILLGLDEEEKKGAMFQSIGKPWVEVKRRRRQRLKEVAGEAQLGVWNPFADSLPTMTKTLRMLEHRHENVVMPWLAAWQLASGHAHGKMWAHLASNEIEEIPGTQTSTGAQYVMTINFGMLAVVLYEAVQLLEVAGLRYLNLARRP